MQCLKGYGDISGYKVKQNKSEAMMISGTWLCQLNATLSHWSKQKIRYLGIILTPEITKHFDPNK